MELWISKPHHHSWEQGGACSKLPLGEWGESLRWGPQGGGGRGTLLYPRGLSHLTQQGLVTDSADTVTYQNGRPQRILAPLPSPHITVSAMTTGPNPLPFLLQVPGPAPGSVLTLTDPRGSLAGRLPQLLLTPAALVPHQLF